MEPFLKSVGGKRWLSTELAAKIMALDPEEVVEPFVGGGAVSLALSPKIRKLVADANPAFATVWNVLKHRSPEEVLTAVQAKERRHSNSGFGYAKAVEELNGLLVGMTFDPTGCSPEALHLAALTLYVNVRSFNGLWRVNQDGGFNVPWGKYKDPRRLTLTDVRAIHLVLESFQVECGDFRAVLDGVERRLAKAKRNKLVIYADPPYDSVPDDKGKRAGFTGYTKDGFTEEDQRHLASWLKFFADRGTPIFSTNADTPLIREIFSWAEIETITEMHSVGSLAARRGERACLLIRSRA